MLTSVEAIVEKGMIRLLEETPLPEGARLIVTVMSETTIETKEWAGDDSFDFQPTTEFGKEIWELRKKITASGGPFQSLDEISRELRRERERHSGDL